MHRFIPESWLLAATLAVLASGCFTAPTRGELGRAQFAYDEGLFGCIFGCDASEPMAARANTFILVVNDEDLPPFVASSSDTSVLEAAQDSGIGDASIRLTSHAPGSAYLELDEASGQAIDRVRIRVADVSTIELSSPTIQSRYLLMIGGRDSISLDLLDDQGRHLKGFGGVDYAFGGGISGTEITLTSALADAIARLFAGSTREGASLDALALGAGRIDVTAPSGASLSIPVEVVDESAVARITIDGAMADVGTGASVLAHAFASDGEEIHRPLCDWSTTSTDVALTNAERESVLVQSDVQTSAQVTCTIGSVSASGTVQFVPPR